MKWSDQREEFNVMVKELEALLFEKGKEYANGDDALGNFKRANDIGISPMQKLGVFLSKHQSSINSYIANGKTFSTESIEGRICDAINYLFLLRCLIKDQKKIESFKENVNG